MLRVLVFWILVLILVLGLPAASPAGTGRVGVYLGSTDRSLLAREGLPAGDAPQSAVVADFDLDGIPDIAVLDPETSRVAVLFGSGDGALAEPVFVSSPPDPSSLTAADVDGDGVPDLLVADTAGDRIAILPGRGDGGFGEPHFLAVEGGPRAVAVGDLDLDGIPDLAVTCWRSRRLSLFLGTGSGEFSRTGTYEGLWSGSLAVEDFDGDGTPDIASPNWMWAGAVYRGMGDGTLENPLLLSTGFWPITVAAGDLNRDGLPDLAIGSTVPGGFTVHLGSGGGAFAPPATFLFEESEPPDDEDLNALEPGQLFALQWFSEHVFMSSDFWPIFDIPVGLGIGDLDGDGDADIVAANPDKESVETYYGEGDGTFVHAGGIDVGGAPRDLLVADLNRDGIQDFVVVTGERRTNVPRDPGPPAPPVFHRVLLTAGPVFSQAAGEFYSTTGGELSLRVIPILPFPRPLSLWIDGILGYAPGKKSRSSEDGTEVKRTPNEWSGRGHVGIQIGSDSRRALLRPRAGAGIGIYYYQVDTEVKGDGIEYVEKTNHQWRGGWRGILGVDVATSPRAGISLEFVYDEVWGLDHVVDGRPVERGGRFVGFAAGVVFVTD